jgi:hypothetical protein
MVANTLVVHQLPHKAAVLALSGGLMRYQALLLSLAQGEGYKTAVLNTPETPPSALT